MSSQPPHISPTPPDPSIKSQVFLMLQKKGQGWVRLRTLYVIAESGTLYRAAQFLKLSGVAAVRNRIRTLEADLNVVLLITDGSGSRLTKIARFVIELVRSEFSEEK